MPCLMYQEFHTFLLRKRTFHRFFYLQFGHWHCSAGWAESEGRSEFGKDAKFDPFYGDGFIAIDAATAHTGKVNVVVIEDEVM